MSVRSVKLISIAAVLIMALVPISAVSIVSEDVAATSDDYSDYYSKQLEKLPKAIYEEIKKVSPSDPTIFVNLDSTWFKDGTSDIEKVNEQVNHAIDAAWAAAKNDNDLNLTTWIDFSRDISSYALTPAVNPTKLMINLETYTFTNGVTPESAKLAVGFQLEAMNVDTTADRYTKVNQIHDWIMNNLSYPAAAHKGDEFVRSVWNAMCGDRTVVCEGYAKTFKAACDYYGIPCIIVTGEAKGKITESPEGHMWNYVKMDDDRWYLVDTTWDDQATTDYTYMLAGSSTDGFNIKISESHNSTKLTDLGFVLPELSRVKYNDPSQKYLVTICEEKDGAPVKQEDVLINSKIALPDNPHKKNYRFEYWVNSADDTQWDFNTPVKKDTVLYAKWASASKEVFDVVYNSNGCDTVIPSAQVEAGTTITIPATKLTRANYEFKGWNTTADGEGFTFEADSTAVVSTDLTLYAEWECTEDQSPYKIDSTIESAGEFLKEESVPGMSNSILTILVITVVVVLISVILISRKS